MEGYSKADSVGQVETVCLITQGQAELPADTLGPGLGPVGSGRARALRFQLGGWGGGSQTSLIPLPMGPVPGPSEACLC